MDDRIRDHVDSLLRFPESGRPGRFAGTRELVIGRTPYLAIYRSADGVIHMLRLLHGAQSWPDELQT